MTYWLILSIAYSCPGGWFSGAIPSQARPFICQRQPSHSFAGHATEAVRQLKALGPGARLFACRNLRCQEREVRWSTVLEVDP